MSRRNSSQGSMSSHPQRNSQGSFSSNPQKKDPNSIFNLRPGPRTSQQSSRENAYLQNVYQARAEAAAAAEVAGQDFPDPVRESIMIPPLAQQHPNHESGVVYDPEVSTIAGNTLQCGINGIPCKSIKFRRPTTFTNALGRFRNSVVSTMGYPYYNEAPYYEQRQSDEMLEDFEEEELVDILMTLVFSALCFVLEIYAFIVLVYDFECFLYSR